MICHTVFAVILATVFVMLHLLDREDPEEDEGPRA